jgi:hypothetical protein
VALCVQDHYLPGTLKKGAHGIKSGRGVFGDVSFERHDTDSRKIDLPGSDLTTRRRPVGGGPRGMEFIVGVA